MVRSLVYLALKRLIQLVLLCFSSSDAKEVEILVLRHELEILRRQGLDVVGHAQPLAPTRALVSVCDEAANDSRLASPDGPPPLDLPEEGCRTPTQQRQPRPIAGFQAGTELIVRLAVENCRCGYQRIKGELAGLGYQVSASSVRRVLRANGIDPVVGHPWSSDQHDAVTARSERGSGWRIWLSLRGPFCFADERV